MVQERKETKDSDSKKKKRSSNTITTKRKRGEKEKIPNKIKWVHQVAKESERKKKRRARGGKEENFSKFSYHNKKTGWVEDLCRSATKGPGRGKEKGGEMQLSHQFPGGEKKLKDKLRGTTNKGGEEGLVVWVPRKGRGSSSAPN